MPSWLKQLLSYVVSFVVYTMFLNWKVSLVLCGGVAFHECGHLYAAKMKGMKTKGFYLIPFMGGVALIADRYKKYSDLAFVALAGPVAGSVLTMALYAVFLMTGSHFIGSAGYWMAWLNLFNLIPLAMLDGGQIAESVVYSFSEKAGAVFLTVSYAVASFVLWHFNPLLCALVIFFGVSAVLTAWKRVNFIEKGWGHFLTSRPERMNVKAISTALFSYGATAVVLLSLLYSFSKAAVTAKDLFR